MGDTNLIDNKKCDHQTFNDECYVCCSVSRLEIKYYIGLKRDWPLTWLNYDDVLIMGKEKK